MADLTVQRGTESAIGKNPKIDGQLSFSTDTRNIFLDLSSSERICFPAVGNFIVPFVAVNTTLTGNIDISKVNPPCYIMGVITGGSIKTKKSITIKFLGGDKSFVINLNSPEVGVSLAVNDCFLVYLDNSDSKYIGQFIDFDGGNIDVWDSWSS